MSEAMIVQGTALQIKEYRGKRVVTFKDIDTVHKRPDGTASRNFRENRQRFISGVDFYKITQPDEIRRLGITRPQGGTPNEVTLMTETGYLMLVKSFTDDLAWKVQRELVDSYFRVRMEQIEENVDDDTPTETVIATDKLIKCAEIMAGCLESNRPYVLNILKHIVPNIEEQKEFTISIVTDDTVTEVSDVTEKVMLSNRQRSKRGYSVGWNFEKFDLYLYENNIHQKDITQATGISSSQISNYRRSRDCGGRYPSTATRIDLENYLNLPRGYFDIRRRKRTRNVR